MNCLLRAYSAVFLSRRSSLYGRSTCLGNKICEHAGFRAINVDFLLGRFQIQCYSSKKKSKSKSQSQNFELKPVMDNEKDAFFVVRKGDVVGVYKTLSDSQAQVGSSICDPPLSVYKGYCLPKEAEEYLVSCGLKNAIYSIKAADLKDGLFGTLIPCPFQQPPYFKDDISGDPHKRRLQEALGSETTQAVESTDASTNHMRKLIKSGHSVQVQAMSSDSHSCILEFDGASKGNPGQAGAGVVLRAVNGNLICRLREGLGTATNNVAEYRAIILGLKYALKKGYSHIRIQGDSKLVCMQVQGLWKVKHPNMSELYEEVKKLKDKFLSFQINHVLRGLNSEADAQANLAAYLADGEIEEELVN